MRNAKTGVEGNVKMEFQARLKQILNPPVERVTGILNPFYESSLIRTKLDPECI
jgi:hypothetical protein